MDMKKVEDFYPLSPMQQGMLFHSLLAPESGAYHEQVSCKLSGDFDPDAFEQAWQRVVDRHAVLRTAFIGEKLKEPIQVVHRQVSVKLEREDWSAHTPAEQETLLEACLERDRARKFDLSTPPLLRLAVCRLGRESWRFIWSHHHILFDGWSLPMLLQEVFYFYALIRGGGRPALPPPQPYRAFIAWLRKQDQAQAEAFWRRYLAGFSVPTPLVEDWPEEIAKGRAGGAQEEEVWLSEAETAALKVRSRELNVTLSTCVQAAWGLLLGRYAQADDVVFGATVSGRPPDLPGSEEMIGLFINTLPVRVRLDPAASIRAWLRALQSDLAEMRQYEYSPLLEVHGWSSVPRGSPLFETLLVYENYPIQQTVNGLEIGLQVEDIRSVEATNYPLNLVAGCSDRLMLKLNYDSSRFSVGMIRQMLCHLRVLLNTFTAHPDRPLGQVSLLTDEEKHRVLVEWNAIPSGHIQEVDILRLIEAQAQARPSAPAAEDPHTAWTYAELNARSNQVARYLLSRQVRPGSIVAISMEHSAELITAILGVLKAGSAYLPLDPATPPERFAFILSDSDAQFLLTQEEVLPALPEVSLPFACIDSAWGDILRLPGENLELAIPPGALAYIIYTSGSTGKPKGVLLQRDGLSNLAQALVKEYALTPATRCLLFSSISFDATVMDIFGTLCAGGALVLTPREEHSSVTALVETIHARQITYIFLPPSMLALLEPSQCPGLETICAGGEALPVETARRWAGRVRLVNAYGPTESTVVTTTHQVQSIEPGAKRIPIGRPLPNIRCYVLDSSMQSAPPGVPGELHIGGVCLARGYANLPELTAEKFIPDPFQPGGRLYKSGDLARYRPDGELEFLGRADGQVKIRGFRIELGEIETLLGLHPAVKAAAVAARRPAEAEAAEPLRLAAYVIPQDGARPVLSELRAFLKTKLPEYMLPSALVLMDSFPLNTSGKVDRHRLPDPGREQVSRAEAFVAPRDLLEEQLRALWEEVLSVRPISVHDNFFELGGHSLLAVRLMAKVKEKLGRELPLLELFQNPTIEGLAAALRRERPPDAEENILIPIQPSGSKPPLFFIHPSGGSVHWYLELSLALGPDQPFYGIQAVGAESARPLQEDIREMAATYVEAIRSVQPGGPYLLGSWSMGVIIAYEVAQQLAAQGQEVAFLGLLDQGPVLPYPQPEDDAAYLVQVFGEHLALDAAELRVYAPGEQVRRVLEIAKEAGFVFPEVTFEQFDHFVNLLRTHTEAWRRYTPRAYSGRITVFYATGQEHPLCPTRDLGWAALAARPVEVREVPGDHLSMMRHPHVQALAAEIGLCIERALAEAVS